jgi:hypothetical protein
VSELWHHLCGHSGDRLRVRRSGTATLAGSGRPDQPRPQGPPPGRGPEQVYWEPPQREYGFQDIPQRHLRPHNGTTILVLGILSLVICAILGPFAWVMGNNDLAAMRAGTMDPSGEGLTQAGRICGMISSILMIVQCVIGGGMVLLMMAGGAAGSGKF